MVIILLTALLFLSYFLFLFFPEQCQFYYYKLQQRAHLFFAAKLSVV